MTEHAAASALRADEAASLNASHQGEPTCAMIDAAIDWSLRVNYNTPDTAVRQAFEQWLAADSRHALAWRRMLAIAGELRTVPREVTLGMLQNHDASRRNRRRAVKILMLTGTAGMSAWLAGTHTPWQRLMASASTATGERRTLTLDDGTTVALNTDTAIASHFDEHERRVELLRGEIYITTGPDAQASRHRPFRVRTSQGLLEALGTRFLVRQENDAIRLAVHEGAVAMQPKRGVAAVAQTGEQWLMHAAGSERTDRADFEPTGWLNGVITARNMPLRDFLSELGRYRNGILRADEAIADHPVTGVYQLQDLDRTLRFLAQSQGWQLHYRSRYWVTVAPAKKNARPG